MLKMSDRCKSLTLPIRAKTTSSGHFTAAYLEYSLYARVSRERVSECGRPNHVGVLNGLGLCERQRPEWNTVVYISISVLIVEVVLGFNSAINREVYAAPASAALLQFFVLVEQMYNNVEHVLVYICLVSTTELKDECIIFECKLLFWNVIIGSEKT